MSHTILLHYFIFKVFKRRFLKRTLVVLVLLQTLSLFSSCGLPITCFLLGLDEDSSKETFSNHVSRFRSFEIYIMRNKIFMICNRYANRRLHAKDSLAELFRHHVVCSSSSVIMLLQNTFHVDFYINQIPLSLPSSVMRCSQLNTLHFNQRSL